MTDFEVVVVDDGSTDPTPKLLEDYRRRSPLNLQWVRQENGGPARARNFAISLLRAPICLMIGDDILASPDLVAKHLSLHRQRPEIQVAGLGLTRWSDSGQTVTSFMRWLDQSGVQFAYGQLLDGVAADWKHFYTSNLSVKTQLLRENPFNEMFAKAAVEDIELGYRLERLFNLEVVFVAEALAEHLHPTSFRQACNRNVNVGRSIRLFHDLWPEAEAPSRMTSLQRSILNYMLRNRWLLSPLTTASEILTRVWCPNPLMIATLKCYFKLGYHGIASSGETPSINDHSRAIPTS